MTHLAARISSFIAGAILSAGFLIALSPPWEPKPYTDVELVSVEKDNGYVVIDTTFYKTSCKFERLIVVGYSLGVPKSYSWKNVDGVSGNRIEGQQRLTVKVNLGLDRPETLEIRTRHICGDEEVVDKVFIELEVPYGEEDLG